MIELPPTLRAPRIDEVPKNSPAQEQLKQREKANIVQGYKLLQNNESEEQQKMPFNFYAEVNIDNSKLWELLISLSKELPDVASLIFGYEGEEPSYGDYLDKNELLIDLVEFKKEIVQDTFIDIGLIYSDEERLIEIYIPESKYVKFWGVDEESFRQIMYDFNLREIDNIEFVDEYPKVREPLTLFDKKAIPTDELIERLTEKYIKN
jgi:hypothetical protein